MGFSALLFALCVTSAWSLDLKISTKNESPFDYFKTGIIAYKKGDKTEAVKSLRYAAEMGHHGANWKLARMYADGDGVAENDYQAYKFFAKIVDDGAEPGSDDEAYVSDALVELGNYFCKGIPNTPVKVDFNKARSFYVRAATSYGNPEAQYLLGVMLLNGEGGEKNRVQAARWFQLSANKGNTSAQALLGNMLFQAGKTVKGLAMLTAAFAKADPKERLWIRPLQERAFAIAGETERRTAFTLATDLADTGKF